MSPSRHSSRSSSLPLHKLPRRDTTSPHASSHPSFPRSNHMERPPSSPVSSIASYGWNGQPSPTLIARLTNTVRIHTPRRSTFPRPVASVLDRITSFVQRIAAAAPSRPSGTKILMLVLFALGTALAVISLILLDFVITAPFAITEVKYIDCSAGRREACTIVRVPAAEYVLDPIVLYEPREHQ